MLRCLFFMASHFNVTVQASHIPGVANIAADALSRNQFSRFLQVIPDAAQLPSPIPRRLVDVLVLSQPDWTSPLWARLFRGCLAPATQKAYLAGKKKYLRFCQQTGTPPFPVTEQGLLLFVAFAVRQGLKHQTIKCYLSEVRHLQVCSGGGDPGIGSMPQLELALRGSKKEQLGQQKRTRLPITPAILTKLHQVWDKQAKEWDNVMLWAACCFCFSALRRVYCTRE